MSSRAAQCFSILFVLGTTTGLAQEQPTELDRLVVSVYRLPVSVQATSASVTVLDGRELEEAGFVHLVDALRSVPGLSVAQSGSVGSVASVFMRGGESDYVSVLVDGVQMNQPGGAFDFAHLTIQEIDRVEIVRGPVSSMYGSDAVTGVIQIFTRTGSGAPDVALSFSGGTFGSANGSARVEGGGRTGSYGLSVSSTRTDGALAFNNEYDNLTVSGNTLLRPDDKSQVRASARYSDHTFHYPTDGTGALVDQNSLNFGDELTLGVEANRQIAGPINLAISLASLTSDSGIDDLPDEPADTLGFFAFQSVNQLSRRSIDVRTTIDLGRFGTGSAGFEFEGQKLVSSSESDSQFGPSSGESHEERSNRAVYGQWLTRWDALSTSASVRNENNETFGNLVSYSVGSAYYVDSSGTKLRASFGRGIKEPTMFENFATGFAIGNPDLQPERSISWEFGIDQTVADGRLQVSATYFDQEFEDLIQYTFAPPSIGDPNFFNVGAADVTGVEVEVRTAVGPLTISSGYTYLDTKAVNAGFESGPDATFVEGERLLRRPAHQFNLQAVGRFGASSAGIAMRRVGDRIDRDFSSFPAVRVTLPAHTAVDLHGEFALRQASDDGLELSITGRIENVFDEDYSEIQGFPTRGRAVSLGGRITLPGL